MGVIVKPVEVLVTQDMTLRQKCRRALGRHRRAAKLAGAVLDYTSQDLIELAQREVQCFYCRMPVDFSFEFEHFYSQSSGPLSVHRLENLRICCPVCNQRKGRLSGEEYAALLELLDTFRPVAREDILARLRAGGKARYTARK